MPICTMALWCPCYAYVLMHHNANAKAKSKSKNVFFFIIKKTISINILLHLTTHTTILRDPLLMMHGTYSAYGSHYGMGVWDPIGHGMV